MQKYKRLYNEGLEKLLESVEIEWELKPDMKIKTFDEAKNYIASLGNWKFPTIDDLRDLFYRSDLKYLINPDIYWSSTMTKGLVQCFNFENGSVTNLDPNIDLAYAIGCQTIITDYELKLEPALRSHFKKNFNKSPAEIDVIVSLIQDLVNVLEYSKITKSDADRLLRIMKNFLM